MLRLSHWFSAFATTLATCMVSLPTASVPETAAPVLIVMSHCANLDDLPVKEQTAGYSRLTSFRDSYGQWHFVEYLEITDKYISAWLGENRVVRFSNAENSEGWGNLDANARLSYLSTEPNLILVEQEAYSYIFSKAGRLLRKMHFTGSEQLWLYSKNSIAMTDDMGNQLYLVLDNNGRAHYAIWASGYSEQYIYPYSQTCWAT